MELLIGLTIRNALIEFADMLHLLVMVSSTKIIYGLRIFERVLYALAFCALTAVFISSLFNQASLNTDYDLPIRIGFACNYILFAAVFYMVIVGKSQSGFLKTLATMVTCVALLGLSIFLFGYVQDFLGVVCSNSLGLTAPCSTGSLALLTWLLLFPSILTIMESILGALLAGSLLHELLVRTRAKQLPKQRAH